MVDAGGDGGDDMKDQILAEVTYLLKELQRNNPKSWHKDRVMAVEIKVKSMLRKLEVKG